MNFIERIKERARENKKTIVLPESMDRRVLEAAQTIIKEDIANIILIGREEEINNLSRGLDLTNVTIINPYTSDLTEELVSYLYELRKEKGMTLEEAERLLKEDYMYYACMLVKTKRADGVVSGACHSTSNTLRPALQIIKTKLGVKLVSAFFLMVVPNCNYGENGIFIFADAGLEQNPDSERLAAIAASSAESFKLLVEKEPLGAMLSHSTMGSAAHFDVEKVVNAVKIAKEKYPQYKIDGELQLDAAIIPSITSNSCHPFNVLTSVSSLFSLSGFLCHTKKLMISTGIQKKIVVAIVANLYAHTIQIAISVNSTTSETKKFHLLCFEISNLVLSPPR